MADNAPRHRPSVPPPRLARAATQFHERKQDDATKHSEENRNSLLWGLAKGYPVDDRVQHARSAIAVGVEKEPLSRLLRNFRGLCRAHNRKILSNTRLGLVIYIVKILIVVKCSIRFRGLQGGKFGLKLGDAAG